MILGKLGGATSAEVLSDLPRVEQIEAAKQAWDEVGALAERGRRAGDEVGRTREVFRAVAHEASALFFTAQGLALVSAAYPVDMGPFVEALLGAAEALEKTDDDPGRRVEALRPAVRTALVATLSRALFERHRLPFLLLALAAYCDADAAHAARGKAREVSNFISCSKLSLDSNF